jgi:hypothetical protein
MSPPNNESSTSNQECTSFETTYQNSEGLSSHAAYESNEQLVCIFASPQKKEIFYSLKL